MILKQGRSAVGPRWAVALPQSEKDPIGSRSNMYIYTTQLAEPAFAIPAVIEHRDRLGGWPDFVQCKMKRAGKARACTVMQTRAQTIKISKRAGRKWATTDWTGPVEK